MLLFCILFPQNLYSRFSKNYLSVLKLKTRYSKLETRYSKTLRFGNEFRVKTVNLHLILTGSAGTVCQIKMLSTLCGTMIKGGDIRVCGIVVLGHFSYGFTVFFIKNCVVLQFHPVRRYTIIVLAFWSAVFGKNSNFVRYFGEGSFLTTLEREGIFLKFQCDFWYLRLKYCGFTVLETPNVPFIKFTDYQNQILTIYNQRHNEIGEISIMSSK